MKKSEEIVVFVAVVMAAYTVGGWAESGYRKVRSRIVKKSV